jgi:hypothetical protein
MDQAWPEEQGIFREIRLKTGFPASYGHGPGEIQLSLPSVKASLGTFLLFR